MEGLINGEAYFRNFTVFAFKICLRHRSVMPSLSGAPPPKKNPGSAPGYRLVSIIKFIDWIPWDSTTHDIIKFFVQKILIDSNQQEFAMKQTCKKDLVGIVTFDLIGVLPTNRIISYFTMAYQSL